MMPHKLFFSTFCADWKSKSLSNLVLWQHFPCRESNVHFINLNHLQCCFFGGNLAKHLNSKTTSVAVLGPNLHIWRPLRPPRRLLNMCVIKSTGSSSSSPGVLTPINCRGPAMCAQRFSSSTWEPITWVFPLIFFVGTHVQWRPGWCRTNRGNWEGGCLCSVWNQTLNAQREQRFCKMSRSAPEELEANEAD